VKGDLNKIRTRAGMNVSTYGDMNKPFSIEGIKSSIMMESGTDYENV
jgi:hypothetical protein